MRSSRHGMNSKYFLQVLCGKPPCRSTVIAPVPRLRLTSAVRTSRTPATRHPLLRHVGGERLPVRRLPGSGSLESSWLDELVEALLLPRHTPNCRKHCTPSTCGRRAGTLSCMKYFRLHVVVSSRLRTPGSASAWTPSAFCTGTGSTTTRVLVVVALRFRDAGRTSASLPSTRRRAAGTPTTPSTVVVVRDLRAGEFATASTPSTRRSGRPEVLLPRRDDRAKELQHRLRIAQVIVARVRFTVAMSLAKFRSSGTSVRRAGRCPLQRTSRRPDRMVVHVLVHVIVVTLPEPPAAAISKATGRSARTL